jgi:GTP-binding protein
VLLGVDRSLISEVPGTTRDSIDTEMTFDGKPVVLVDTAGLRRKGRVTEGVERHSVLRALASVRRSDVCLLVIDAMEGVTDQDAHIAGYVIESMRGLAVVISKWDLMPKENQTVEQFDDELEYRFRFIGHAPVIKTSSVTARNVDRLIPTGLEIFERTRAQITTGELNRYLLDRAARRTPPSRRGRITRLRYSTQTGTNPPTFRLFFSDPRDIPRAYIRYLENGLREHFGLQGAAVRMVVRGSKGT